MGLFDLEYDEENKEFKENESYKEIFRLEQMLLESNVPYKLRRLIDGWQICYPDLPPDNCVCSVIEHFGSYGHEDDLLEIMGLTQNDDGVDGTVEGWLSAEDVFNRICEHYKVAK